MYDVIKICKGDKKYPDSLKNIKDAPDTLYCAGDTEILNSNLIAIIGKRDIGERYSRISYNLGKCAAELDMIVINGLALGCDRYAAEGALSVGGKVVAVMPSGLDIITPASHRALAEKIVERGGCIISEYPLGTAPEKYRYIQRDRIQAYLANRVFVVYADTDGGTMHTVKYAARIGKPIGCFIEDGIATGNILISQRYGTAVKNKEMFTDFVEKEKYKQMSLFDT